MKTLLGGTAAALLVCWPALGFAQEVIATSVQVPTNEAREDAEVEQLVRIALSLGPKASTPAQLVQLARNLDGATASTAFLRVAREFLEQGKIDVAADVVSHLLREYPTEPAAVEGGLLLLRIYSSSELAHSKPQTQDSTGDLHLPPGWQRNSAGASGASDAEKSQALLVYSSHLARQLLGQNPKLSENPEFAFQCAVIARRSLRSSEVKSWLTIARHQQQLIHWRQRALAETWLQDQPDRQPPVPVVRCSRATGAPHLDGQLDDTCWRTATVLRGTGLPAVIFFARNDQYCYLAGRCEKQDGVEYTTDDRPRTYDADLTGRDRVEISLDVDRDYASCYRLTVDHRGRTNDSCWLDRSWNPKWFVAAGEEGSTWTFEAAIPWSELTSVPPRANDAWAVAARRIVDADAAPSEFQVVLFAETTESGD